MSSRRASRSVRFHDITNTCLVNAEYLLQMLHIQLPCLSITVVPISLLTSQGNKNKENHGETNGEASEPMDTSGAAGNQNSSFHISRWSIFSGTCAPHHLGGGRAPFPVRDASASTCMEIFSHQAPTPGLCYQSVLQRCMILIRKQF